MTYSKIVNHEKTLLWETLGKDGESLYRSDAEVDKEEMLGGSIRACQTMQENFDSATRNLCVKALLLKKLQDFRDGVLAILPLTRCHVGSIASTQNGSSRVYFLAPFDNCFL